MLSKLPGLKIRGMLTMFIGCTRHSMGLVWEASWLPNHARLQDREGGHYIVHKRRQRDLFICQIYVDDVIFGSTNDLLSHEFATMMSREFEMSMIGELTFFLGFQVKQLKEGTFIHQENILKISWRSSRWMNASRSRHPWQQMGISTWMWTVNRLINPSIVLW